MLEWGAAHRRDLPWRRTRDPWLILVSEVMLQQTQVGRVIPAYRRFVDIYPSAGACARARPAEVVRLWDGLGYNRRALNLHRSAAVVDGQYGGAFPEEDAALRALPGVGVYTARALRSFAFGHDVAAVDTNVVRVLARSVAGAGLSLAEARVLGDRLVPPGRSWEFNQGMFDLGATVCTATRPDCPSCPLRVQCRWRRDAFAMPDPWRASPSVRPQAPFAGSDRQGRGRLLHALRQGELPQGQVPGACGWPDDPMRALRIAEAVVTEGFAEWSAGPPPMLRLI